MAYPVRKIILVLIALSAPAVGLTIQEKQPSKPCPALDLIVDPSTDVHAQETFKFATAAMLKSERFQELDCTADSLRSSKARFAGGAWKLHTFYTGLEDPLVGHATEEDWQGHISRLQRWIAEKPLSITARVALAKSYGGYAWAARGEGMADTVSQSGWKLFGQRLEQARATLEGAAGLNAKCPEWYVAMEMVGTGQGWGVSEANQLMDKAIAFEPSYYATYRMHAGFLLPKWHGEDGDTAKFAQEVSDRLGGPDGDVLYFEIATGVACRCGDDHEASRMSWSRIQKGASEVEKQYGVSLLNLNQLAYMALKFHDPILAEDTFKRLGDNWDKDTWGTESYYKRVQKWATTAAPQEAHNRAMKQVAEWNLQMPQGAQYKAAFEEKLAPIMQQCVQKNPENLEKFDFLVMVGEDGHGDPGFMTHVTPIVECLRQTLAQPTMKPFPRPPRFSYWILLELDPVKFIVSAN